jgi:hypothetical protein
VKPYGPDAIFLGQSSGEWGGRQQPQSGERPRCLTTCGAYLRLGVGRIVGLAMDSSEAVGSSYLPQLADVGWGEGVVAGVDTWMSGRDKLQSRVRGRVLTAEVDGYEESRSVFNAMIDRYPVLIIRCEDAADVVHGVTFARDHGLNVSVKGGGHSVSGSAVCDGGVMLDMSAMTKVVVNSAQRIAVAESGALLAQLDAATAKHGLATPLGVVSLTGIAGLTLGGGLGWLNGKHGLACDNLLAVDIVTADGRLLTATAQQHEDLFWAVRGGGGNFGVVVSFTYRLHPVAAVLAGAIVYPADVAAEALIHYHEVVSAAPDELSTSASLWRDDRGVTMSSVGVCWSGRAEDGPPALRRLREFGPPVADEVRTMPYAALQQVSDGGFPRGRQHYWKASFLKHLTPEVINVVIDHLEHAPSPYTGVGFQQMTGLASRVAPSATAFAHRAKQYDCLILSQWDDPADSPANVAWTRSLFEAMTPFLEPGVYVNNLGDEEQGRAPAAFGHNYERLSRIKAACDPGNLFRSNANIGAVAS